MKNFLSTIKSLRLPLLAFPLFLFYLGVASNILCVSANHGAMPVIMPRAMMRASIDPIDGTVIPAPKPGDILDEVHVVYNPATDHLVFLADFIAINHATDICSPGDLALWAGDFLELPVAAAWFALLCADYKKKQSE